MKLDVKSFYEWLISPIMDELARLRAQLADMEKTMLAETQAIITEVAELKTVVESAEALITKLMNMILTANDLDALKEIAVDIRDERNQLAAAVSAGTNASTPPAPAPDPSQPPPA